MKFTPHNLAEGKCRLGQYQRPERYEPGQFPLPDLLDNIEVVDHIGRFGHLTE